MVDKNTFMETLHLVQEIAKTSNQPMDKETALSYFKDMELSEQQKEMVYEFLMLPPQEEEAVPEEAEENSMPDSETEEIPEQTHFQMYLDEIDQLSKLDENEEEALYQELLAGDEKVIGKISTQWLKQVIAIAEEYKDKGFLLDDLVQEGNMGLLLGLNELVGAGQVTDIKVGLEQAIRTSIEDYIGVESGDEQQSETILGKVSLVHQAKKLLSEEKGHEASLEELASYTGVPVDEIQDILSLLKEK